MEPVSNSLGTESATPVRARSASDLGSDDFMKLLITQLTNQDPLDPTKNEDLLRQIASIREIELNSTLTQSLQSLAGQQRFASASTLLGQYVTSLPAADGTTARGLVVGVRFTADGQPLLKLSDGTEVAMDQVNTIAPPQRAAEAMVGLAVAGVDRRAGESRAVEGVVTAVRMDAQAEVILELDGGDSLRLRDVLEVSDTVAS